MPDIPLDDVLQIHAVLIERFGGSPGLRNRGILQSSLEQPHSEYFGHERYPTVIAKAAAYLYYVCQNHPFVDGNKRVAFALCSIYLNIHGMKLNMTVDEAENLMSRDTQIPAVGGRPVSRMMSGSLVANLGFHLPEAVAASVDVHNMAVVQ